jgi:hypothetical protein
MIAPDTSFEEFRDNPNKFGFPTFEQFLKNKDHYLRYYKETAKLDMLDNGPTQTRMQIRKQKFYVNGHFCRNLEKVQHIAECENIDLRVVTNVQLIDVGGNMCDQHICFDKKKEPKNGLILAP